jgi:mercuric ion transport protein
MPDSDPVPRRTRWSRHGYVGLMALFAACVLVQIYVAGMAVFIDPTNWRLHAGFVHVFELVPVPLLVVAYLGGLPRPLKWTPVVLYLLVGVQYATAHQFGTYIAAIHPVNAVMIFAVAAGATKRAWSWRGS